MGIELCKALFAREASGLTASEVVVLGYMCVVSLDKENTKGQPARMYFAGWEPLALALGYDSLTDPAKTKVKRAMQGLREKGLVTPTVAHAQTGSRQSYRINVGQTGGLNATPYRGSDLDPQEGVGSGPKRGSESDPPRTNTGRVQDLLEDISIAQVRDLKTARARREATDEIA